MEGGRGRGGWRRLVGGAVFLLHFFFCFGLDMSLKCNVLNHFSSFGFRTGVGECASAASL